VYSGAFTMLRDNFRAGEKIRFEVN
jgi:hypothetical protein